MTEAGITLYVNGLEGPKEFMKLLDALLEEILLEVGNDLLYDMNDRIDRKITPSGGPQKENAHSTVARKGHDVPLRDQGYLEDPTKYTVKADFAFLTITPPSERASIFPDLKAAGYDFFTIPTDPADYLQQVFDRIFREKASKPPYDKIFSGGMPFHAPVGSFTNRDRVESGLWLSLNETTGRGYNKEYNSRTARVSGADLLYSQQEAERDPSKQVRPSGRNGEPLPAEIRGVVNTISRQRGR